VAYEISQEQRELSSVVARLVGERSDAAASYDGGPPLSREVWAGLVDAGLLALSGAADVGGAGAGLMEETLVAEQLGAGPAAVPVLTVSVLAKVLSTLGSEAAAQILETVIADGRVVLAGVSASTGLEPRLTVIYRDGAPMLSGRIGDLLEAACADALLLPVHGDGGGISWYLVETGTDGARLTDQPTLDRTQRVALLECLDAPATHVGDTSLAEANAALDHGLVLAAAQALGAASRALRLSVDHAKQRRQFGQPIGRFQAVKHRLVDMLVDVENARSAVYNAAWAVDGARDDAAASVRMAKAVACENAVRVVHEAIQVHGGIGYTWEHGLHLLLRRAKSCQLVLGGSDQHFDALAGIVFGQRSTAAKDAAISSIVDAAGDRKFHRELSGWLDEHLPTGWGTPEYRLPRDLAQRRAALVELQRTLAGGRWVGIHWPVEFGGRDASLAQQITFHAEMVRRGVPQLPGHRGISIVGPALIKHGTPEQQRMFIDRIRTGDDLWAGGFSEPGAGSDLASLSTRAVIDGDKVVINGQKIWTSSAHWSNWIYLLVRTNPDAPKHNGISVVLVPLDSPGITVRPIRQITGSAEFNEVFFDDVVVPVENILGPVDGGWAVNRTTLSHEHFTLFIGAQARFARSVDAVIDVAASLGIGTADAATAGNRNRLARQWAVSQLLLINGLRNVAKVRAGADPGPEGSIAKLFGQESERRLFELALDLCGPAGILDRGADDAIGRGKWVFGYLGARGATIGGGTSEIHRNKIGESVLGLPRDASEDG
jgi:alkylation response protein AidB-like acyl-CoA dehydrogenase